MGKFITEDDIARRNPPDVKALLGDIAGVLVNDRGITFQRCQKDIMGVPAHIQVYVDGVRLTRLNSSIVESPDAVIRDVLPTSIHAMEVYTGVSQIPAEFLDDACGVIAIWTKSR